MRGLILFVVVLQVWGSLNAEGDDSINNDVQKLSAGFNAFAKDLYQEIAGFEKGNFVVSPISVSLVLSMLALGSTGSTRKNLRDVLHFEDNSNEERAIKSLVEKLDSFSSVDLKLANQIFISDKFNLIPTFNELSQTLYKTSPQSINYSNGRSASRVINRWAAEKTNSRIRNIVTRDDIDPDTVMMLLNAVYFKGKWAEKFDQSKTEDSPFKFANGTVKMVPTMFNSGKYATGYLRDLKSSFLRLPYQGQNRCSDLSMYIILPSAIGNLSDVEKNLFKLDLNILSSAEPTEVDVFFPRFKVDSKLALNNALINLGLTHLYRSAEFGNLVSPPNMVVSDVSQKAFIEVNEEGSEAAAVTEVGLVDKFGGLEFRVDSPFISLITTKNSILFMSRIVEL